MKSLSVIGSPLTSPSTLYLIYDWGCLLCDSTALGLRLKHAVEKMLLLYAREPNEVIHNVQNLGYNLNEGVVVLYQDTIYHASEAMHMLATYIRKLLFFSKNASDVS